MGSRVIKLFSFNFKSRNVFGFPEATSQENSMQKTGTFRTSNHANNSLSTASTENTIPAVECNLDKARLRRIPIFIQRKEVQPKVLNLSNQNLSAKSLLYSFGKNDMSVLMDSSNISTTRRNTSNDRIRSSKKPLKIKVLMDYSKDINLSSETTKGNYLSFNNQNENSEKTKNDKNFLKNFESLKNLLVLKPGNGIKSIKAHQTKAVSPIKFFDTPDTVEKKISSPDLKLNLNCKKLLFRSVSRNHVNSAEISAKRNKLDNSDDFSELSPQDKFPVTTGHKKTRMFSFNELNNSDLNSFRENLPTKIELPKLKNRSVQNSPKRKLGISQSASALKSRPSLAIHEDFIKKLENIIIKPMITPVAITTPNSSLIDPFRTPKILFHREALISREKTPVGKISTKFKNQDLILDKLFNPSSHKKKVLD